MSVKQFALGSKMTPFDLISKNTGEESNTGTTAKVAGKVSCSTALFERTSFPEPNNVTLQMCLDNDSGS